MKTTTATRLPMAMLTILFFCSSGQAAPTDEEKFGFETWNKQSIPGRLLPDGLAEPGAPITLRAMPVAMDIASGMSVQRRAMVHEQAKTAILGSYLDPTAQYDGMVPELDLGDAFRTNPTSDVPVLMLSGTLDGRTHIESQRAAASAPQVADEAAILSDIAAVMADRKIPGAQVAVVTPDGAIWERSLGVRDLASSAPMTTDTLIQLGSVTKIFTASLAADLVAKGTLEWSDGLAEWLPGVTIRPDLAGITLEQLVTHTSRLPANPPNRIDADGVMQAYGVAELRASLVDPAVGLTEPGRNYSNWGYALLGHIVERAAGKAFEDVLKERIFGPLEMSRSRIALAAADEHDLAVHYWPEDQPRIARPRWVFGEVAGFGGITSTASDLARFLRYQIRPEARPDVLDAPAIRSLRPVRTLNSNWQVGGGRGWLIVRDPDGTITIEHSGEVDGHSSYMGFSPDTGVGVAVAANLGGSSAREIALPVLARAVDQARHSRPVDKKEALAWFAKRQWADAEAALANVVTAAPADGEAWHHLGLARYELHDLPGAEAALLHAARNSGSPDSSLFMLAVIAAAQGRTDAAFQLLDRTAGHETLDLDRAELRALRSDPRWPRLAEKLQHLP